MTTSFASLLNTHHSAGCVDWIGVRPERLAEPIALDAAELTMAGLSGDHARAGKRALTLIQAEHLPVIAALCGHQIIAPELLRRNLVISGINLTALRHGVVGIGDAHIQITKPCAPCSRMEAALGPGGYNAMRGHGGWCAEVIVEGQICLGDRIEPITDPKLILVKSHLL